MYILYYLLMLYFIGINIYCYNVIYYFPLNYLGSLKNIRRLYKQTLCYFSGYHSQSNRPSDHVWLFIQTVIYQWETWKAVHKKLYGAENPHFGQNVTIFRKCNCDVVNSSSNFTKLCNCHFYVELLYHAYRQHDAIKT